jgi:protein TonB
MNHWPSFEPFGSAGESGRFLALWSSVVPDEDPEKIEAAVPVEPETSAAAAAQSPVPPAVDPADQAARPTAARGARFSPLLLFGSLAVHAAAIALTAHFLTPPGVEAETDAVSVEIVVDATPNSNTDPSLAGEAATEADTTRDKAHQVRTEAKPQEARAEQPSPPPAEKKPETAKASTDETPAASPETQSGDTAVVLPMPAFSLPATPPDIKMPPQAEESVATRTEVPLPAFSLPQTPPAIETPKVLATPQAAEIQVPQPSLVLPNTPPKVEIEKPAPMSPDIVAKAVPAPALKLPDAPPPITNDAEPPLALPDEAPLPAPAPDEPEPAAKADKATAIKETPTAVREKQEARRNARPEPDEHSATRAPRPERRASDRSSSAGVGDAAGRGSVASRGGASAGEKAAYAARLNSHLQRFQRYPAEAQRDGISGSTRMAITIDRGGRLLSSRLAGSSGSAILDEAAKATVSRASPYPPPPDGVGGRTLTFAATIRFRR